MELLKKLEDDAMERLKRLRDKMAVEQVDLVAIGPGAHLKWLFGLHPHGDERPLICCVTSSGVGFLMPGLEAESARQHTDLPFFEWSDAEGPSQALEQLLATIGASNARSIVLDETMRADHAALVQDRLSNATRQFCATTVGALRMRKDPDEYMRLKRNAQSADVAMQAAWEVMAPGMTEIQVAEIIGESFASQGAKPIFMIVGTGSNGAFPHHQTGNTVLQNGDVIVMDIGARLDGYSSDMTRMVVLGTPPEGYLEIHAIVEAAVQAGLKAARPGVKAHVVDDAARQVIVDAGYGDAFVHRTGHGLGVQLHEEPYISASSQVVLEEGMVFSIEPGIYLPDRFGLRLEEIVILREDGPEILSDLPRTLKVISK